MPMNELQPDEVGATPVEPRPNKVGRALASVKRELTDEDLASPGAQKMLLEELERLREDNVTTHVFRNKFHDTDKQLAVATEKLKHNVAVEIVTSGCLAIGAAALGYVPAAWSHQPDGWIALIFGVVLLIVGIIAKAIKL